MSFKTIVVHCDGAKPAPYRLAVAADVACRFEAVLVGVYAKVPFEPPLFVGKSFDIGRFVQAHRQHVREDEAAALAAFENTSKGKPFVAEWRSRDGRADQVVKRSSRCADLLVVGQTGPHGATLVPGDLPEAVAIESGRPASSCRMSASASRSEELSSCAGMRAGRVRVRRPTQCRF